MLTNSSDNFSDEFRSEAQLTWMALLLASFALGAVFIWSLSNQPILMPSVTSLDAPVAQISQLPKRVEVAATQSSQVDTKVIGETPVFETKEIPANSSVTTAANDIEVTTVAVAQNDIAPAIDTSVKTVPVETLPIDVEKMELSQVELVETGAVVDTNGTQAEVKPTTVAPIEDPATIAELQEAPIVNRSSKPNEKEVPDKLAQDNRLLAELTAAGLATDTLPATKSVTPAVTPPETAFEKLRREELALLATYSETLQIDLTQDVLDSVATSQLFQIFDLLFLYSETPVSVTVKSNDTDSSLSNINKAQQRGDKIVDYLVLSGLDRGRFNVIAQSAAAKLPLGSHLIVIQATLDP